MPMYAKCECVQYEGEGGGRRRKKKKRRMLRPRKVKITHHPSPHTHTDRRKKCFRKEKKTNEKFSSFARKLNFHGKGCACLGRANNRVFKLGTNRKGKRRRRKAVGPTAVFNL